VAPSLHELLQLPRLTSVVDIGANPVDGEPAYWRLLAMGGCTLVGFEPQEGALKALQKFQGPLETYLPYAIGDGRWHDLHVCQARGMTSLLEPNPQNLRLFDTFWEHGKVVEKQRVKTRRLDDLALQDFDLLKLDVQGFELPILRNGRRMLRNAVCIQIEVSFIPLYKDQPVFWEVDKELRKQGFLPHRLHNLNARDLAPLVLSQKSRKHEGQLLEADFVYCRDFTRPNSMTVLQWQQLAVIAHYCYGSFDLTLHALRALVELSALPNTVTDDYVAILNKTSEGTSYEIGPLPPPSQAKPSTGIMDRLLRKLSIG